MNQPAHYVSPNDLGPTIPSSNPQRSTLTSSAINYKLSTINFRKGFSFAEVMFAVVILGIGFILIAAIFPVAIQQSQATAEESSAAAIARQAAAAIASLPTTIANPIYSSTGTTGTAATVQTELLFPPTVRPYVLGTLGHTTVSPTNPTQLAVAPPAVVVPFLGTRWDLIKANAILPSDPRYAYAAFYKRENNSSAAELIVVAMIVRNRPVYTPSLDEVYSLGPTSVTINTTAADFPMLPGNPPVAAVNTVICPDTITVTGGSEGGYVQVPSVAGTNPLAPLGRTYTLGRFISSGLFEMMPGDDMGLTAGSSGLWGTAGRITDVPAANIAANLYPTGTLQATVAYAQLAWYPGTPSGKILLTSAFGAPGPNNPPPPQASPGAFIIIADDNASYARPQSGNAADYQMQPNVTGLYSAGALNGRIFRLGKQDLEDFNTNFTYPPGVFDLDPQYGMRTPVTWSDNVLRSPDTCPNPYQINTTGTAIQFPKGGFAKVYIIGAGKDPSSGVVVGGAQDIGCFATYIQVQ
jgi:type II secretory pathway pseudopilin PulG